MTDINQKIKTEDNTILSVKDLNISFNTTASSFTAVNKLSMQLNKGKTLAIVGESGSGKSLTALALMGLLPVSATTTGTIILNSGRNSQTNLTTLTDNNSWQQIRGAEIGMIFQEPMSSLNPVMKIGKQLSESIITHQQIPSGKAKQIAIDWLRQVQLPNPDRIYNRYPHQLSGGQKQRVMIAMAMCNHPVLLIADEPTTALDVTVQMEVIRLMRNLQQESGTAMMFITHDLALAATIADDVLVMYKGEVMEYGKTDEILLAPEHPYTKALIACKPSPEHKNRRLPTVADFMDADQSKSDILLKEQPQSSALNDQPPNSLITGNLLPPGTTALLTVKKISVWFPERKNWLGKPLSYFKAVDSISFSLRKGEVLGLVGESGCGKSTLSRSLIGLIPVHSGELLFKGQDIAHLSPAEWGGIRRKVQMIFQDPFASLNPRMKIGDILTEPMYTHHIVPKSELRKESLRLLDLVSLPANSLNRYPHQFSGGQRQRIGIARALALRPELLICDESVSALDVSIQAQTLNLLKELQAEFQLSYLFISHDLSVVHYISDRVMVMQSGKIIETGEATDLLSNPQNQYTRQLIAAMPQGK